MKTLLIFTLIMCAMAHSFSQKFNSDVISTSGSSIVSEDMVISWTIGDNLIDFFQSETPLSTTIENQSGTLEMKNGTLIEVYPILTTGFITICIKTEEPDELQAELFDIKGSQLEFITLDSDNVEVDLNTYEKGMYIIRIYNKDLNDRKVVKIIKQ